MVAGETGKETQGAREGTLALETLVYRVMIQGTGFLLTMQGNHKQDPEDGLA